jgi:hypothetical protein
MAVAEVCNADPPSNAICIMLINSAFISDKAMSVPASILIAVDATGNSTAQHAAPTGTAAEGQGGPSFRYLYCVHTHMQA